MVSAGVIFKIMHWPGASILLTLGIFVLLFIFLPPALLSSYKGEGRRENLALYVITWITCLVIFISMLFKIQHWPGAGLLMVISLPFPFVVFLPVYLYVTGKNERHNIYNTVAILFLLTIISSISALLALNVSKDRIDDSLLLLQNYDNTAGPLAILPARDSDGAAIDKVNSAINLLDEYEDMLLLSSAIDQRQWKDDPKMALAGLGTDIMSTSESIVAKHSELQQSLSEIVNIIGEGNSGAFSAENIATMLGMIKTPAGVYLFADGNPGSMRQPWPLISTEGLRVNLTMLKLTL